MPVNYIVNLIYRHGDFSDVLFTKSSVLEILPSPASGKEVHMQNVLIIGGNRFFGKSLVKKLLGANKQVTLLNRGNSNDGFGDQVQRIRCDRQNPVDLSKAIQGKHFNIVYDQVCYDAKEAIESCEIFAQKTDFYVFTSSQSVYPANQNIVEDSFQPVNYRFETLAAKEADYAEAKRQAEAVFAQQATFPVCIARFPIVVGPDDYTERFSFHLKRIKNGQPIFFPSPNAKISFVEQEFAAEALYRLGEIGVPGPVNIASKEPIRVIELVEFLGELIGKKPEFSKTEVGDNHSPYGIAKDWYMNVDRLEALGLKAKEIKEWIPNLIKQ